MKYHYEVYTRTNPDTPMTTCEKIRSYNAKSGFHYAFFDNERGGEYGILLAVVPIGNVDRILFLPDDPS